MIDDVVNVSGWFVASFVEWILAERILAQLDSAIAGEGMPPASPI